MIWPLRYRVEVRDDLDEAYLWDENRRSGLGEDDLRAVRTGLDRIQNHPEMHAVVKGTVRRAIIRRFGVLIFSQILDESLLVIAILHGRQNPDRWQARI